MSHKYSTLSRTNTATSSRMSTLPETATVKCHFTFALIGPKARAVASCVMEADMHVETVDMLGGELALEESATTSWHTSASESGEETPSVTVREARVGLKADEFGTWCMVDDSEHVIARIRFQYVEGFSESLPTGMITDANSVRDTCFVFLADSRLDSTEVETALNSGFTEMNYLYSQVKQGVVGKLPKLRAVLLRHVSRNNDSGHRLDGTGDDPLTPFASRLKDVCGEKAMSKNVIIPADFDNRDMLYECVRDIAKDLYSVNFQIYDARQTTRSKQWTSVRFESSATAELLPKKRTRMCNIQ